MKTNVLNFLYTKEEQLISLRIQKDFFEKSEELKPVSQKELHLINANLLLTNDTNIAFKVHKQLINALITIYIKDKYKKNYKTLQDVFNFQEIEQINSLIQNHIDLIPELVEELHITFLNSEFSVNNGKLMRKKSKHHLRETGAVYTLKQITNEIVDNCISNAIKEGVKANEINCLDFASGTWRFYFLGIEILHKKYDLTIEQIVCNNLFAIDIDEIALTTLRLKVISYFEKLTPNIINALTTNILHRNGLVPKVNLLQEENNNIDLSIDFKTSLSKGGFDVIFSNPPYYLLKINKKDDEQKLNGYYSNLQNKIQNEIKFFRTSGFYNYSIEGMLNYYQLSIEMIIKLTKANGQIGIICPSSIFADLTSAKLRKYILTNHKLHFIRYYPEAAKLFENVSQSTVIFYVQKAGKTDKIGIEVAESKFEIKFETIKKIFPTNLEIPLIDKIGWSILAKISEQKKIKEIPFLRNRRGELDLTLFKSNIINQNTGWRLVRGNMISENGVVDKNGEFVEIDNFLSKKSEEFKLNDFNKVRLICQQISNVDLQKRLKFILSEKTDILGNSCNYIVSTRNEKDLEKLHYILNSSLLNWRFKITSSNNHINNYELDELPIVDIDSFEIIDFSNNETQNDYIICKLYGLTNVEIEYLTGAKVKRKLEPIYEQETV
ncbi:MAG TPA: Eco57I restriction-modification methylase domain-containing protein [Bacteroidia bacterium]|nr:Eco57I restriction-modification methylase domain-containing protein [Bacteroidia bacterium]